jgi:aminomethyltransferase
LLRTPLHSFHLDRKGHMVEFAGWDMPLYYSGITEEHKHCRTSGALFDVSHMGRVTFKGRHAKKLLETVCTRRIGDMTPGQCRYSLVCNEQGGVHDDVIVYKNDEDDFLVVVNASNRAKLLPHFEAVRSKHDFSVKIDDQTEATAMIALQGPKIMPLVATIASEIASLKRYRFAVKDFVIASATVSRTGYTGEDGVEIILPAGMVSMALSALGKYMDASNPEAVIKPAGLGCRDTLRIEAGMPLYGHELGEDINALSCGVDFAIALDKDQTEGVECIGLPALKKTAASGPDRKLVGLEIDGRRAARQGMAVMSNGRNVGTVTSGCLSPTLNKSIAMAFVERGLATPAMPLSVDTGKGATLEGKVVPLPFYKMPK